MSANPVITGVYCAAATPVAADLSVDVRLFTAHCRHLLDNGCDGIALLGTTGPVILPDFLPPAVRRGEAGAESSFDFGGLTAYLEERLGAGATDLYADYQALTDRHLFGLVLRHTGGNLSQASRLLGITRATLRAKLAALGMRAERPAADGDAG